MYMYIPTFLAINSNITRYIYKLGYLLLFTNMFMLCLWCVVDIAMHIYINFHGYYSLGSFRHIRLTHNLSPEAIFVVYKVVLLCWYVVATFVLHVYSKLQYHKPTSCLVTYMYIKSHNVWPGAIFHIETESKRITNVLV